MENKLLRNNMRYTYKAVIVCKTCGKVDTWYLLSVNPHKKMLTYKAYNPLTGLSNKNPLQKLACGHKQDLEGHKVTKYAR